MRMLLWLCLLACLACKQQTTTDDTWIPLFNGENLDNWEIRNGTATFEIVDNAIVGTSKLNTPNTFLCTKNNYEDFILELELKVDSPLNSGIQIRSNSLADYRNGVIHGYQVEVDPSPRAFSGGIYDEQRRGWLYPLCENAKSRKAFKLDDWNKYRIEAIGSAIRVWVNGVPTANLMDDMTRSGFIGLQVHSIGDSALIGKKVRWRNINIQTENLEDHRQKMGKEIPEINLIADQISKREVHLAYQNLMFKNNENWTNKNSEWWTTQENAQLISTDAYGDFDLKFQFKIKENSEAGIQFAPEAIFQIIDPAKEKEGTSTIASLKNKTGSQNLCVEGRGRDFRGFDHWNVGRIIVKNGTLEHWMNGYKMIEITLERGKPQPIVLQNLVGEIGFRGMKIRRF